uniref:Legume lectin domain-containing protein n=1 Tax=Chenopodium quinoa TaxID=63459 RepID=A0A803L978_CHEQI
MANFKALPLLLLALIAFSMLATVALANNPYGPGSLTINLHNVQGGARTLNTANHACFSATNAAGSAFVFHQASMATSKFALATTTGRPNRVAPSALNFFYENYLLPPSQIKSLHVV